MSIPYLYQNKRQKPKRSSLKIWFYGGLFFCLIIGLVYVFLFSPLFIAKEIKVAIETNSSLDKNKDYFETQIKEKVNQILEEKLWRFIPQKSVFLVSSGNISKAILGDFPEIKSAEVTKKALHGLEIKISGWQSIGVWCQLGKTGLLDENGSLGEEQAATTTKETGTPEEKEKKHIEQCYYIDEAGVIYQESPIMTGSLILTIFDSREQSPQIKTKIISPEMVKFILAVKEGLSKIKLSQEQSLEVVDFEIISLQDLRVTTAEDWQIYFDTGQPVEGQIKALKLVLEQEIKEARTALEYVDLRVKGRVYYK